jgi:hypothetical protein
MSTDKPTDEFTSSAWDWFGIWLLTLTAVAAFINTDRSPFIAIVLGVSMFGAIVICFHAQRQREKRERQDAHP